MNSNPDVKDTMLRSFDFSGEPVRVINLRGAPWFVAKDVARTLSIAHSGSVLRNFPEDEKAVHTMHTPGGEQDMTVLSEPGLYRLIFQSRKKEAERFKKWVFTEVLPALRATGRYELKGSEGVAEALERALCEVTAGIMSAQQARAVAELARSWASVQRVAGKPVLPAPGALDRVRAAVGLRMLPAGEWPATGGDVEALRRRCLADGSLMWIGAARDLDLHNAADVLADALKEAPAKVAYYRTARARIWAVAAADVSAA